MIKSARNPQIRALKKALRSRNKPSGNQLLVEGPIALASVLDASGHLDSVLVTPRGQRAHPELIKRATDAGATKLLVAPEVVAAFTRTQEGPSVAATALAPEAKKAQGLRVILDGVKDPRALGACLQSCAAFGVVRVSVTSGCADPWSAKVIRASCAAAWWLQVESDVDLGLVIEEDRTEGRAILAIGSGEPHVNGIEPEATLVMSQNPIILIPDMWLQPPTGKVPLSAPSVLTALLARHVKL